MKIVVEASTQHILNMRVEKANKALAKSHMELVKVLQVETLFKMVDGQCPLDWVMDQGGLVVDRVRVPYLRATLEIPDSIAIIEGQEVTGRIQKTPVVGNMVTSLGDEPLPERFRTEAIKCDHCGTKRVRKASWIIRKDGELLQIGDQCATAYFGVNVENILYMYEKLVSTFSDEDDDWGGCGRRYFEMNYLLNCVAWLTLRGGFVTRKVASSYPEGFGIQDTASRASWILWGRTQDPDAQKLLYEERNAFAKWMGEQTSDLSAGCLEWWNHKNQEEKLGDFEWNVLVALFSEKPNWSGLAAYGMKMFLEATDPSFKLVDFFRVSSAPVVNEPLAPEKTRVEFKGICTDILDFEDYRIAKVQTDSGHLVSWFLSSFPEYRKGDRVHIKATVKGYRDYKGILTTQVNRPKVLEVTPMELPQ